MGIIEYFTSGEEEKSKESGGMSEEFSFEVNSRNAGNETVDWDGPVRETEELEKGPKTIETEEGEVVQLGKFPDDEEVTNLKHDVMQLSISDIERHSEFFTEEEKEELMKKEHHLSEEELSSVEKVQKALDDPSLPNDRRSLWTHLCKQEGRGIWANYEEELSDKEIDRKTVEAFERQGYDISPEEPENKSVKEMTGDEFKQVMQDAMGESEPTEEEELEQSPEPTEEEPPESNFEPVDEELAQAAKQAWNHHGGVWSDIAEDIEKESEIPDTRIESLGDGFKKITTQYDELQVELMQLHNQDDSETKVLDMTDDGTMVARAYEGDL